ncbi:hypothetical protein JB92DRAFT_74652 [Gautieria morchelliformis]|nr:hypothetical protein JB92DRAFT_74652 [Gautieria morchelliformis]
MVMLSLGEGTRTLPVPARSGENIDEVGEVGVLGEGTTNNPTLFGSTGEERRQFFRAARRWITPRSPIAVDASSLTPQQSSAQPPVVTVSPSFNLPTLSSSSPSYSGQGSHGDGLIPFVSVTGPTPSASPRDSQIPDEGPSGSGGSANGKISSISQGKRKKEVESEDETQPNEPNTRSILLKRRDNSTRTSDASHAPSSFRHAKRIRLSTPSHSPPHDGYSHHSRTGSPASRPPSSLRTLPPDAINPRTLSQSSIPLRAIVSPKPPSIDRNSSYHMRDPALPPSRRTSTQWTGSARMDENIGRVFPLQAWAFVMGFLVFPLWWVAAAAPVGWGWARRDVGGKNGKGTWSEEELAARAVIEHDVAYTWRRRCRFMSLLGLLVYIPLIVLLAVLVPRG